MAHHPFCEATKFTSWLQGQSAGLSNEHPDGITGSSTALINLDVNPVIGNAETSPCCMVHAQTWRQSSLSSVAVPTLHSV
jgi:hypothetical protein